MARRLTRACKIAMLTNVIRASNKDSCG
jgi:hypothetical protein